jgi:hypothetical protein
VMMRQELQSLHPSRIPSPFMATLSAQDIVLSHPKACQAAMRHDDTYSLIWDS